MRGQKILRIQDGYGALETWLDATCSNRIFLVCRDSVRNLKINGYFEKMATTENKRSIIRFSSFRPNPDYESVKKGVKLFREMGCDCIIAVGGGSAMDVAKCVKLYAYMDPLKNYLEQPVEPNDIPLAVMPTTAGTGSEATQYAVIYYEGKKQSITHESCIPSMVIWDSSVLETLPEYQKKSTMLDALCHAIESWWSVNSTRESQEYSRRALQLILKYKERYLCNDKDGNEGMLEAAHLAGKAINIAQTTAGHAMCYKLTSLYGLAHGHAAALCVAKLWPYMLTHMEKCMDIRGEEYLKDMFAGLGKIMG